MLSINTLWRWVFFLGVSTGLVACASSSSNTQSNNQYSSAPVRHQTRAPMVKLDKDQWLLYSLNGKVVIQSHITLTLAKDGTAHGFAGCNQYTSKVNQFANGTAKFSHVGTTRMLCTDGVKNTIERDFVNALQTTTNYQLGQSELVLMGAGNRLVFYQRSGR